MGECVQEPGVVKAQDQHVMSAHLWADAQVPEHMIPFSFLAHVTRAVREISHDIPWLICSLIICTRLYIYLFNAYYLDRQQLHIALSLLQVPMYLSD